MAHLIRSAKNLVIEKIIMTVLGRVPVTERTLKEAQHTLGEVLIQRGFSHVDQIPVAARASLVQETFRRAAEGRSGGSIPVGAFCSELEATAAAIVAAFEGHEAADPRIKGILEFYGVRKKEPNSELSAAP